MGLTQSTIDRINGKKLAESVMPFVLEEFEQFRTNYSDAFSEGFWGMIKEEAEKRLPPKETKKPPPTRPTMTDDEAKAYERKLVGFGYHQDKTISDCPTDYLLWLNGQNENLGAYLRSERGQQRQDESP